MPCSYLNLDQALRTETVRAEMGELQFFELQGRDLWNQSNVNNEKNTGDVTHI